jgi:exodeoxyribonuclease V alpha subunit
MSATLDDGLRAGVLTRFDVRFARGLGELGDESSEAVLLGAALAARGVLQGHVCLDVGAASERLLSDLAGGEASEAEASDEASAARLPSRATWLAALRESSLVGDGASVSPLVLDDAGRLYLRRYWLHQRALAESLARRVKPADDVAPEVLRDGLVRLFAESKDNPDWQRVAAAAAVLRRFAVISGGPGTGKTTTVVRVLALLVEQALARGDEPPRIVMVAPTGKAAARLVESIKQQRARLDVSEEVRAAIPEEASTIHRCLGVIHGSATRFRHNETRPLVADVLIVDEASMVDLALMRRLLDATPEDARVLLLGDKDQLASVEAGSVLGDICGDAEDAPVSAAEHTADFAARVHALTGDELPPAEREDLPELADGVILLRKSHRYGGAGPIGGLARAINEQRADDALALLDEPAPEEADRWIRWVRPSKEERGLPSALRTMALTRYAAAMRAETAEEKLRRFGEFRILCAHRRGPLGAERVNADLEASLVAREIVSGGGALYDGRPVMVKANDYDVGLYNGDIGVLMQEPEGEWRACFVGADGEERRLAPSRLPPHETVFAMTVHKSQGSEFDEVLVILPPMPSPVLTRELLYTAVTRARARVTLLGREDVLRAAIEHRVQRASGLRDLLWRSGAQPVVTDS